MSWRRPTRRRRHSCSGFVSLQQFSVDVAEKASNVCLAHLFTYQDFDEGTLGLAYVAPSKLDVPGGLCSKGAVPPLPWPRVTRSPPR